MVRPLSRLVLALAVFFSGGFFVSFWGRNAAWLGRNHMGLALAFSFAVPLALYSCAILAIVSLLAGVVTMVRRDPAWIWFAAFTVAIAPLSFILCCA
jgi:hypothetical protein